MYSTLLAHQSHRPLYPDLPDDEHDMVYVFTGSWYTCKTTYDSSEFTWVCRSKTRMWGFAWAPMR